MQRQNTHLSNEWTNLLMELLNGSTLDSGALRNPADESMFSSRRTSRAFQAPSHREREPAMSESVMELFRNYNANITRYQKNVETILRLLELDSRTHRPAREPMVQEPDITPSMRNRERDHSATRSFSESATVANEYAISRDANLETFHSTGRGSHRRTRWASPNYVFSSFSFTPITTTTEQTNVGLTPEEIQHATREIEYEDASNNRISSQCPISLEEFLEGESILQIQLCGHVFKPEAIRRWFLSHDCCPVCRRNVRNPASTEETSREETSMEETDELPELIDASANTNVNANPNAESMAFEWLYNPYFMYNGRRTD